MLATRILLFIIYWDCGGKNEKHPERTTGSGVSISLSAWTHVNFYNNNWKSLSYKPKNKVPTSTPRAVITDFFFLQKKLITLKMGSLTKNSNFQTPSLLALSSERVKVINKKSYLRYYVLCQENTQHPKLLGVTTHFCLWRYLLLF